MKKFLHHILLNRWSAFAHDLIWVPVVLAAAYYLRFNLDTIPVPYRPSLIRLIAIAVPVQAVIFWVFGLYRALWRFASIPDLVRIIKGVGLGILLIVLIDFILTRLDGVPRSVLFLYPLLLVTGLSVPRISYRWFKDHRFNLHTREGQRTIIVGAGRAGELLARDIMYRPEYQLLAFVDDDPEKLNREIHGIRVVGGTGDLAGIVQATGCELVLLAMPSVRRKTLQRLVAECDRIGVVCKTLPSVFEMSGLQVEASRLRSVTVEDLLGRDTIHLDYEAIAGYLRGRSVLVTGGGGSIGSELCRQIARQQPAKLIILEHAESNLYAIEYELRRHFNDLQLEAILGDVKNHDRVNWVFRQFKPDIVFHAAAYKHVPMLEGNPAEGVSNNIYGTRVIADAADRFGVDRFVLVSTDKAVNPANVMGATKRVAEIYCQNLEMRSATKFITTRFGNVLGSVGSVVPLFAKQIKAGGPVTVTDPEITRYFMTIPEAVSLILQAGAMGRGGEIFVLDMGEPVRIQDLAQQMIRLSGLVPGRDIKIVYTGLRPGEKLFEELLHAGEDLQPTSHEKLLLARSRQVDWNWLQQEFAGLEEAVRSREVDVLKKHLQNIVPEYRT
ncbi:MAG TPA: polysaccharide biosynthesis protein [Desulfobulbaceae bacterium]|nr:polysaccharide biosynthesis protein [Desulfobulbaceae bacterium]